MVDDEKESDPIDNSFERIEANIDKRLRNYSQADKTHTEGNHYDANVEIRVAS